MGHWGNAADQAAWKQAGWSRAGWTQTRSEKRGPRSAGSGRWTSADLAVMVVLFWSRWELGLAFLALKLWHQASGEPGSTFSFTRRKWDQLVDGVRSVKAGSSFPVSMHFGERSSGNLAFDTWRRDELARIDAEREKLRTSEQEFARYRDDLMRVKDREDFDRFMQTRDDRVQ